MILCSLFLGPLAHRNGFPPHVPVYAPVIFFSSENPFNPRPNSTPHLISNGTLPRNVFFWSCEGECFVFCFRATRRAILVALKARSLPFFIIPENGKFFNDVGFCQNSNPDLQPPRKRMIKVLIMFLLFMISFSGTQILSARTYIFILPSRIYFANLTDRRCVLSAGARWG